MTEISDSLQLLFETSLETDGDRYVVPIPTELVEGGSLSAGETYRIALLAAANAAEQPDAETETEAESEPDVADASRAETVSASPEPSGRQAQRPPVEEGEIRSVTIDTLGDQGDGIAKVERGFIVIVPGTKPGDQVDVEITDVKETVAFAEPVSEATVR